MKPNSIKLALVVAFALLVGDFAYRTWNAPAVPEYQVTSTVTPMSASAEMERDKHLYLRKTWTLTEPPSYAWLQVMGHDTVQVFVNGQQVGRTARVAGGRVGGDLMDVTSNLHVGKNSIAIHARQLTRDRSPQVSVEGECHFVNAEPVSLSGTDGWVASDLYDRRGTFWYETDFPAEHWQVPAVSDPVSWTAQVEVPPTSVTTPRTAAWITPVAANSGSATLATEFELSGKPSDAWIRLSASGPYRLAINGWMVADDRLQLGADAPQQLVEQTLDITTLLRPGTNTVAIALSESGAMPRVQAELQSTTPAGEVQLLSDSSWQASAGIAQNWMQPDLNQAHWQNCREEIGFAGMVPRAYGRHFTAAQVPTELTVLSSFKWFGWVMGLGLVAAGCCWLLSALLCKLARSGEPLVSPALSYWALLPSTTLAAAGGLMTWDLAWTNRQIYQPTVLFGLLALVLVLWMSLYVLTAWRPATKKASTHPSAPPAVNRRGLIACWIVLFAVAGWLRFVDILDEPIHHDEVSNYNFTMSIFEYGFPAIRVHEDLPMSYCSTSELSYYFNALVAMVVDDPRLIVRLPSALWSLGTLLLIGFVGTRWFNAYVGVTAGLLYAVSPHVISMANFGRYLSEVQFFTLLTTYLGYEAVRGTGKLRVGYVWAAGLSFIAMYLSWEGSGLYGVGLGLAALLHRRRHLAGIFSTPAVYPAVALVVLVVAAQNAHRILQQTHRLWYGTGISSMKLEPMWRFPFFDADYFLINASWTRDALLPTLAVVAALVLAFGHRWRLPIRFLLVCLLTNAGLMAMLLPLQTNRYSYHLTAIVVLLAGVSLVAIVDSLFRAVREVRYPALRLYATSIAVMSVSIMLIAASGWAFNTSELKGFVVPAQGVGQMRSPDWEDPSRFVMDNYQPGDVVISILPHAQNFQFAQLDADSDDPMQVDYWLETRLVLQATIGDSEELARDRRSGAVMLYNLEQIERLFADHDRIWYCTTRFGQSRINDSIVSQFLREHMDVVYEDLATAVLLRDRNHRTADVRLDEQKAGSRASDFYLE